MVHDEYSSREVVDALSAPPSTDSHGWVRDLLVHGASSWGGGVHTASPRDLVSRDTRAAARTTPVGFHDGSVWWCEPSVLDGVPEGLARRGSRAQVDAAVDRSWRRQAAAHWPHLAADRLPGLPTTSSKLVRLANPWMSADEHRSWETVLDGSYNDIVPDPLTTDPPLAVPRDWTARLPDHWRVLAEDGRLLPGAADVHEALFTRRPAQPAGMFWWRALRGRVEDEDPAAAGAAALRQLALGYAAGLGRAVAVWSARLGAPDRLEGLSLPAPGASETWNTELEVRPGHTDADVATALAVLLDRIDDAVDAFSTIVEGGEPPGADSLATLVDALRALRSSHRGLAAHYQQAEAT